MNYSLLNNHDHNFYNMKGDVMQILLFEVVLWNGYKFYHSLSLLHQKPNMHHIEIDLLFLSLFHIEDIYLLNHKIQVDLRLVF